MASSHFRSRRRQKPLSQPSRTWWPSRTTTCRNVSITAVPLNRSSPPCQRPTSASRALPKDVPTSRRQSSSILWWIHELVTYFPAASKKVMFVFDQIHHRCFPPGLRGLSNIEVYQSAVKFWWFHGGLAFDFLTEISRVSGGQQSHHQTPGKARSTEESPWGWYCLLFCGSVNVGSIKCTPCIE